MSATDDEARDPNAPPKERLPDNLVLAMKRASRASVTFTALAAAIISLGTLVGIRHGEQLEQQAERARELATAKANEASVANRHADSLSAFVEGRTPSAVLSGPSTVADHLHPTATFKRDLGVTHFTLGMSADSELAGGIKGVTYKLNPAFFSENTFQAAAPRFEAVIDAGTCLSTVTAEVALMDGSSAKLTFDWCKLSGWTATPNYDRSELRGADQIHPSCTNVRALLFEMPNAIFRQVGPVQMLRQVYRADSKWQATGTSTPVTFVGQRRSGDDKNMALVAKCHAPEPCIALAAAYHAAAGGTPPTIQCGDIPGFDKVETTIPSLRDGAPASLFVPGSKWESCFRLTACEVSSIGTANQYPQSRCVSRQTPLADAVLDCAQRDTCGDVLTCAAVAAHAP